MELNKNYIQVPLYKQNVKYNFYQRLPNNHILNKKLILQYNCTAVCI